VFWLIPAITVYTIVMGVISLVSSLIDRRGYVAHWCARVWSWLILITTGVRVNTTGIERVSSSDSYIFISNHQSIYDIPILFSTLPFQLRIVAKASLRFFPLLGWHLRYTGHLLVNRARTGIAELNKVSALIGRGHSLLLFPEGTRSVDGRVGRFKRGIFLLAVEAGLPIVPVSITGSRDVMRKGRLITCPGKVQVVLHEPISTSDLIREDVPRLVDRVHRIVESAVTHHESYARTLDRKYPPTSTALR
jgi:1-acyl-sn-glycerol-3-phosphate acyltransferase